jgi:type IV pilus assembly protein PilV
MCLMRPARQFAQPQGFTLLEILIALLLTGVGLLGVARMQALTISATHDSGVRSLVATQTVSLASIMHANPAFWAQGFAPASITATGNGFIDATGALGTPRADGCQATPLCNPAELASVDLKGWAEDMNNQFPSYNARIDCTTTVPISCAVRVTWLEKTVAVNKSAQSDANAPTAQYFSAYIQP